MTNWSEHQPRVLSWQSIPKLAQPIRITQCGEHVGGLVPPATKDKREAVHAATRMEKFMRSHAPITNRDAKSLINKEPCLSGLLPMLLRSSWPEATSFRRPAGSTLGVRRPEPRTINCLDTGLRRCDAAKQVRGGTPRPQGISLSAARGFMALDAILCLWHDAPNERHTHFL